MLDINFLPAPGGTVVDFILHIYLSAERGKREGNFCFRYQWERTNRF